MAEGRIFSQYFERTPFIIFLFFIKDWEKKQWIKVGHFKLDGVELFICFFFFFLSTGAFPHPILTLFKLHVGHSKQGDIFRDMLTCYGDSDPSIWGFCGTEGLSHRQFLLTFTLRQHLSRSFSSSKCNKRHIFKSDYSFSERFQVTFHLTT